MAYRKKFLSPERMVVVIAGDVGVGKPKIDGVIASLEEKLGAWEGEADELPKVAVSFEKNFTVMMKKDIEQAHYCLGWPGVSWKDKRRYAAKLTEIILSGNSSSKLWNAIREERGLAYYLFPISEHFEELGVMGVQAGVARERLGEAIEVTKNELLTAKTTITEADLIRAKDYLVGKLKLSMDQTDFWCDLIGQRLLLRDEILGVEDLVTQYTMVTLASINDYIGEFIRPENIRCLTLTR